MRALVIKPTPCCGYAGGLGKPVDVSPKPPGRTLIRCHHCKAIGSVRNSLLYVLHGYGNGQVIQRDRVQILPDDIADDIEVDAQIEIPA